MSFRGGGRGARGKKPKPKWKRAPKSALERAAGELYASEISPGTRCGKGHLQQAKASGCVAGIVAAVEAVEGSLCCAALCCARALAHGLLVAGTGRLVTSASSSAK